MKANYIVRFHGKQINARIKRRKKRMYKPYKFSKKAKRISHKRYNRLQHLWRYSKKYRVRKKNYSILCDVLEEM